MTQIAQNTDFFQTLQKKEEIKKTEGRIQAEGFEWFNNTFPHLRGLLYHVPNGEKRDPVTANKLKAMGVVAGIPDIVFHFRARTYFFEFKRPEQGTASEAQLKIHKMLDQQRFTVWIVDNVADFKYLINGIVEDESEQFTLGTTKEDYFYKHKVYSYLYSLGDAEVVGVADVCEEETRQKFVNCVTDFMVEGFDKLEGFEILFTPDYEAFYKKQKTSEREIIYKGKTVI